MRPVQSSDRDSEEYLQDQKVFSIQHFVWTVAGCKRLEEKRNRSFQQGTNEGQSEWFVLENTATSSREMCPPPRLPHVHESAGRLMANRLIKSRLPCVYICALLEMWF